jgi:hypothetical protein
MALMNSILNSTCQVELKVKESLRNRNYIPLLELIVLNVLPPKSLTWTRFKTTIGVNPESHFNYRC